MRAIFYPTWDQFKACFWEDLRGGSVALHKREFIFRGQSSADWRLEPSVVRFFPRERGEARKRLEDALLNEFVAELGLSNEKVPEGSDEKWALGQHYELPTPLLDWSLSLYVAAFFAFDGAIRMSFPRLRAEEIDASKDRVALFALRRHGHIETPAGTVPTREVWKEMGVPFIEDSNPRNSRIRAQLGLFTLLPPDFGSLDECVESFCEKQKIDTAQLLTKFAIPFSAALGAMADLFLMDISPRRVYGDLIGAANAAALRMRLNYYDGT